MLPSVNNHAASQISLSRYSGSEAGLAYTPIQAERQSSDRPQAQMLRVAASRAPSSLVSAGLRTSASVLLFTFRSCSLSVPNIAIDEVPWFSSSSCSCIISASALFMPQQQKYLHDCCSLLISSLTHATQLNVRKAQLNCTLSAFTRASLFARKLSSGKRRGIN